MKNQDLDDIQSITGHRFTDQGMLHDALTHASTGQKNNYERLEFLGDRVLGLIVAQLLYEHFPEESEGDLAKRLAALVQGRFLAKIAREIDLGRFVQFSEAERVAGGADNENILADVFESLVGALYLDSNLEVCRNFIGNLWADHFFTMEKPPQHPKTTLQEWAQSQGLPLPTYEITGQKGPDHAPVFTVTLSLEGYSSVEADGASRQKAEKQAARRFLEQIGSAD